MTIANDQMGRTWKEMVTTYLEVLSQHLLGGIKEKPLKSARITGFWAKRELSKTFWIYCNTNKYSTNLDF
jgi:hypothetical protein